MKHFLNQKRREEKRINRMAELAEAIYEGDVEAEDEFEELAMDDEEIVSVMANYVFAPAKGGDPIAQARLGDLLVRAELLNMDMPSEMGDSESWYLKAATQGEAYAMLKMSDIEFAAGNEAKGEEWLNKAYAKGAPEAYAAKADMYIRREEKYEEAYKLYNEAYYNMASDDMRRPSVYLKMAKLFNNPGFSGKSFERAQKICLSIMLEAVYGADVDSDYEFPLRCMEATPILFAATLGEFIDGGEKADARKLRFAYGMLMRFAQSDEAEAVSHFIDVDSLMTKKEVLEFMELEGTELVIQLEELFL